MLFSGARYENRNNDAYPEREGARPVADEATGARDHDGSRQVIDFYHGVAEATVSPAHDRGVRADLKRSEDGGFLGVRRGQGSLLDFRLLAVLPIVIDRRG